MLITFDVLKSETFTDSKAPHHLNISLISTTFDVSKFFKFKVRSFLQYLNMACMPVTLLVFKFRKSIDSKR